MMRFRRAAVAYLGALLFVPAWAQQPMLNSERIEQTFGSYEIAVVFSDASVRLSNLSSRHGGRPVTRTFAVVSYPAVVAPSFRAEHEAIVAGGSIGATFDAAGWSVVKTGHHFFAVGLTAPVAVGMQVPQDQIVAAHAYRLSIEKEGRRFDYAMIIELHHPDYLNQADLKRIYGEPDAAGVPESTRRALAVGLGRLERLDSALREQGAQIDDGRVSP